MKIVEINLGTYGSTGTIMHQIADLARREGHVVITCAPYSRSNNKRRQKGDFLYGCIPLRLISRIFERLTGLHEWCYISGTLQLFSLLNKEKPDLIHLHNIHSSFLNLKLLFNYIKRNNIRIAWTLHDCWSFTGHCPHFEMVGCDKWQTECYNCPRYREYPVCQIDDSKRMYRRKKEWFNGVKNLTLVAPSRWMQELIPKSFLKHYQTELIYNGIDLNVFKPQQSDFKGRIGLGDRYMLLGVSMVWNDNKGLDVFIELARRLNEKYRIVLVGTDETIDKVLPTNIISIHQTDSQQELALIYSAADLFVNPTREELFGLVNAEALACGTPVITFRSGGSPEVIDESCGCVVERNNLDALEHNIINICERKPFSSECCRERAELFDKNVTFRKYVELYKKIGLYGS